jgi:putative transcriptional regulator
MIVYKNVQQMLRDAGLSTTKIRNEKLLSESTLTRIRNGKTITTEAIDIICNLLHCQPNDIIEVVFDNDFSDEYVNKND